MFPKWEHATLSRMRIIARRTLQRHVHSRSGRSGHAVLKASLEAWFDEVRRAKWTGMAAMNRLFRTASVLSPDRIVFDVKANDYRLVTAVDFEKQIVWIKWIGSRAEYDRIDVKTIAHERTKADSKCARLRAGPG